MSHDSGMSRRGFVAVAVAGSFGANLARSRQSEVESEASLGSVDPTLASASVIAAAIRQKQLSSLEATSACLARIQAVNPLLNAVVQLRADEARAEARNADQELAQGKSRGPLHGVPMTIKDSLDTTGMITAAGTKGWAKRVPTEDATVVARLRAAGAIVMGKTNTPEITMSYVTDNLVYGRTNNPYDRSRTPGGSSGGAAAIIAAGGSPLDIGSDSGGSIRLPAHFCGVAGLKPTSGRVPLTGHVINFEGPWGSWTHLGPLARSVDDLILVLPIIAGFDWHDPHVVPMPLADHRRVQLRAMRVAMFADNGVGKVTAETAHTVQDAGRALRGAGMVVAEAALPEAELTSRLYSAAYTSDAGATLRRVLDRAGTKEHGPFLNWMDTVKAGTAAEVTDIIDQIDRLRSRSLGFLRNWDVLLCPVHTHPALPHGVDPMADGGTSYLVPINIMGWPAATVRCGTSLEGLPIGVQVVGRPWREDIVLAVAKELEHQFGGWKPPRI
ncbi:MAG TPA: amidase family protein [Terriglobales bacterium]